MGKNSNVNLIKSFIDLYFNGDSRKFRESISYSINHIGRDGLYKSLLPTCYTPGTFKLIERCNSPQFLPENERKLDLNSWIKDVVQADLNNILNYLKPSDLKPIFPVNDLPEIASNLLQYKGGDGKSLIDSIWNQEYSDIFRNLELFLLTGIPNYQLNTYQGVNDFAKKLTPSLLFKLQSVCNFDLLDWCKLSVASGLIGLNEKSVIDATSAFYKQAEIPILLDKSVDHNVSFLCENLLSVIKSKHRIDNFHEFLHHCSISSPQTIAVFADDYIETIFLLKFYEILLMNQKQLVAILIPKSKRAGNDATFYDIQDILQLDIFNNLNQLINEKRFIIRKDGPQLGGLNLEKLDDDILKILCKVDFLDIRGCRAFEMAQGIKKVTYYSFNIIREISESITGIDGESRQMVFLKQLPGQYCFRGFRERNKILRLAPSGRKYMVVPYTAYDYFKQNVS